MTSTTSLERKAGTEISHVFVKELHTGNGEILSDTLITIANGGIAELHPAVAFVDIPEAAVTAAIGAPGFIDLQINGAMDLQFTNEPTAEAVEAIVLGARRGGTAHVLPTFTTAPETQYLEAFDAIEKARSRGVKGILGMHLEGPFLNADRPGIHKPEKMRPIDQDALKNLLAFSQGKLLVTLAPECQPDGVIQALTRAGVIVFAGHSQAKMSDIVDASSEGLSGATHLFNAMSQMTGREPGLVGSVLSSASLYAGIIADGHHVDYANISIAASIMKHRLFLVTDAMRSLEGCQKKFLIQGKEVSLEGSKLAARDGTLAGAHVAMDQCVRNVINNCGISRSEAFAMASTTPARVLGMEGELGAVRVGHVFAP